MDKKYYSTGEVAKILDAKEHNLRSLDHLLVRKLTIIRGRRYYKSTDIEVLRNSIISGGVVAKVSVKSLGIDSLLNSMLALRAELLSAL